MTQPNDSNEPTRPPADADRPQWAAPAPPAASAAPSGSAPARTPETIPPGGHDVPVAPVTTVRRPSRRRGVVDVVLVVAAIFALGGVGFALGRVTAPASQAIAAGAGRFPGGAQLPGSSGTGSGQGGFGAGAGGFLGGGGAGITISGEVTAITADQLTLKLASGQTIQIAVDATTAYHTHAAASASDVTTGSTVQVQVTRGAGNGGTGSGGTDTGRLNLGAASSVTVVPK
jgi:hypothetical protein